MAHQAPIIIKKKKVHGHGHHGGAWKVAFADFVTAMMAFFMVMWIMGMSQETRMSVQGYFNDPFGFTNTAPSSRTIVSLQGVPAGPPGDMRQTGDDPLERAQQRERKIKEKLEKVVSMQTDLKGLIKNLEIFVTKEGLRVELVEATYAGFFESGSAILNSQAKGLIHRIAPILKETGRKLIIEGHTDSQPFGRSDYTNWDLSTDRALSLRQALSHAGIPDSRFQAIRGLADTELKRPDDPLHFSNRRVTILLPFKKVGDSVVEMPKETVLDRAEGAFQRPVHIGPGDPGIVNAAIDADRWQRKLKSMSPEKAAAMEHATERAFSGVDSASH